MNTGFLEESLKVIMLKNKEYFEIFFGCQLAPSVQAGMMGSD